MTKREQNEKKKEYLNRYRQAVRKYNSLQEQEKQLRSQMDGPKAIEYSDMPKAHKQTDLSDYMVRLERILDRIANEKNEMQKIQLEIEEKIIDVMDGEQSRILYLRYIQFMKWEDICVEMGYSWRQIHNIHSKALNDLKIS
ncbi:hypothetical protein DWV72_07245 [Firmicutes bacterium AF12-30]|jgi:DNA-directed RNA polymerase specialized sigma24 family protein|nr:hypothetical protein DWV72_07245 [Firmicutes bacterium AF12-30]